MSVDPRAYAPEPLVAPPPLPLVSRQALRRINNPLPAPTSCHYCGCRVELVCNSLIYKGKSYGKWPYAYLCSGCWAYVGLHPETDVPLGTLANNGLRASRNRSKAVFYKYLEQTGVSRTQGYRWLAEQMQINTEECHFGWFEQAQCDQAEVILQKAMPKTAMAMAFARAR